MKRFFQLALPAVSVTLALGMSAVSGLAADEKAKGKGGPPPDDPSARAFLREAEEHSPAWTQFPGFSAKVNVYFEGKNHEGRMEVGPSRKVKVTLSDPEAKRWVSETLTASLVTAFRKPFEERYEGIGVVFGKDDLHPLGMLVELRGDPYKTRFRIRDGEFRVIERTTPEHHIRIHVLNIERDEAGRKKSRSFLVSYFDKESGHLRKSEAIREERILLRAYALPSVWIETEVRRDGGGTRSLTLTGHQLLPADEEKPLSSRVR